MSCVKTKSIYIAFIAAVSLSSHCSDVESAETRTFYQNAISAIQDQIDKIVEDSRVDLGSKKLDSAFQKACASTIRHLESEKEKFEDLLKEFTEQPGKPQ